MEDCCAVCAEPLEWIAYGPCGHRDVCSTCTARLRVVLDDKRCCICKQDCPVVFVTKALGDYTKVVADFSSLCSQSGLFFDDDIGAYSDDQEEFKRIKAMCRMHCKICEESSGTDETPNNFVRKGFIFKNIQTLRRHLYGVHRLVMCELCLEGRKVFIREQKLYSKNQLERHSSSGDSKADGTEEERGGFGGHPMCVFCSRRFYGENELYHHMSTEHYTCHLCQRARPGQYEYYQHYDDLEVHFRNEHVLCEDPECLSKKFVVFSSEGEFKIHNAKEHGGNMTRAQRIAALKIPVTLQFRRSGGTVVNGRGRGGRGRGSSGHHYLNAELLSSTAAAVQESVDTANLENNSIRETTAVSSTPSSSPESFPALRHEPDGSGIYGTSVAAAEAERARYISALHGGSPSSLVESAFPPLPGASQLSSPAHVPSKPLPMSSLFPKTSGKVRVMNVAARPSSSSQTHTRFPGIATCDYPALGRPITAVTGPGPPPAALREASGGYFTSLSSSSSPPSSSSSSSSACAPPSSSTSSSSSSSSSAQLSMEEIRVATKALQESIRAQLNGNEKRFGDFREVQLQFRKGNVSSKVYLDRIADLGLSNIIPQLARLCPDPHKQQELLEELRIRTSLQRKKNGGAVGDGDGDGGGDAVVEILSSDGYRKKTLNGASPSLPPPPPPGSWICDTCTLINQREQAQCVACGGGEKVAKKKSGKLSKFERMRLGSSGGEGGGSGGGGGGGGGGGSSGGVWKNGGGQRLVGR